MAYWETYHFMAIAGGAVWGIMIGWLLRGENNNEKLLSIQTSHMKELFEARKARLCDLLGLPVD